MIHDDYGVPPWFVLTVALVMLIGSLLVLIRGWVAA